MKLLSLEALFPINVAPDGTPAPLEDSWKTAERIESPLK
jgi:hypothetical protein